MTDRASARRELVQSRQLWNAFRRGRPPDSRQTGRPSHARASGYTYVRARQSAPERVGFTILAVERDRVVVRALIDADPHALDRLRAGAPEPRSLWVERGSSIGSHDAGARALTIDQLYDHCESEVLGRHPELAARLYFHPNGLLMQCGFLDGQCDDCPAVSIHSVSLYSVAQEPAWLAPSRWLCGTDWGMFPPGAKDPLSSPDFDCWAAPLPSPAEANRESGGEGLADICKIDPAACPERKCSGDCVSARWTLWRPPVCGAHPARKPRFLEVGKRRPLDGWTFPFRSGYDGIECTGESYLRRVRPAPDGAYFEDGWVKEKR